MKVRFSHVRTAIGEGVCTERNCHDGSRGRHGELHQRPDMRNHKTLLPKFLLTQHISLTLRKPRFAVWRAAPTVANLRTLRSALPRRRAVLTAHPPVRRAVRAGRHESRPETKLGLGVAPALVAGQAVRARRSAQRMRRRGLITPRFRRGHRGITGAVLGAAGRDLADDSCAPVSNTDAEPPRAKNESCRGSPFVSSKCPSRRGC